MQQDEYYILAVSFYCLVIGFVIPRLLFRIKFLPIGYLALGGISAILGFTSHLLIYGADHIWANKLVGMILSTIVCLGITSVIYVRKKSGKEPSLKPGASSYNDNDIEEIKSLIADNDIEKACEKLIALTSKNSDRNKNNELILIKGKIQKIKSENRIGVLTNEEKNIGFSRVSYSLLEIANSL